MSEETKGTVGGVTAGFRSRFSQLKAQRESIIATSPRAERDERYMDLTQRELETFNSEIQEHEKDLYALDQEIGMIVRALKGKTGS